MAYAVQRSIKCRRNIVSDMNKEKDSIVDDFEASTQFDTSEMSLAPAQEDSTISLAASQESSAESGKRQKMLGKSKSEKKSKTKTIAELRQQLHDCNFSLVEIQENDNLKHLKLKMDHDELNESYLKLKQIKSEMEKENEMLKRKLSSVVGADRMEWIAQLEANQAKLQNELGQATLERENANKLLDGIKKMCCQTCLDKMQPARGVPVAPVLAPSVSRSLWSLFQLDEEAKATTEAVSTLATICGSSNSVIVTQQPSPPKIFVERKSPEPTNTNKISYCDNCDYDDEPFHAASSANDDLEADLEAIEQKMKDDIENMSREWKQPSKKPVNNHKVRRDLARSNKRSSFAKSKSTRDTLDSFFSITKSIRNLGAEEMDEEKSFYSIQRSVSASSSPEKQDEDEEKQSASTSSSIQNEALSTSMTAGNECSSPFSQDSTKGVFGHDVDPWRSTTSRQEMKIPKQSLQAHSHCQIVAEE